MNNSVFSVPKYIAVNSQKKIKVLEVNKIIYLKSSGRYTILHLEKEESIIVCKNLGHYEKLFQDLDFLRIHNSFIVNVAYLSSIIKDTGRQYCVLKENLIVPISNRKLFDVKSFLNY
ncbi:LytR/AlgR family response regulator transcription factor [Siansivirga zeaxanthinifaciens]|uniref:HTH LytTR-type domain-containing protein n=1 Tax=Siansivirga zeaxanthinifaciens CC-SAMT-1 TaxID=1454006 RepID=A0A0C5WP90_9FLAO|nr:LytTR family transcriptional regulator DNA-binding domain-containing protein [Siansivirga zeaxanthinifaciens]AJR04720.1 hypothetical protein AW14_01925 [Siansivirga zeaxanthinifaciens CC-SAMT-1]